MYLKELRQKKHFSQEHLAEESGLSLRTIQRIESGHRVGYASLRALAAVFDINVDILEQELYSMDKLMYNWKDFPFSVKILFGKGGWIGAFTRAQMKRREYFCIFSFLVFFIAWLSSFVWAFPPAPFPILEKIGDLGEIMGLTSVTQIVGAYIMSLRVQVGDKYDLWSRLESLNSKGSSGISKNQETFS